MVLLFLFRINCVATCALALLVGLEPAHARFMVLYSFTGGSDGSFPRTGMVKDASGNLYGTTYAGGGSANCEQFGCGTVFKIAPGGTETVLHAFAGGSDGAGPWGTLLIDKNGSLYGTTLNGGGTSCPNSGCGTVFKVAPDGTETVLYSFTGSPDGQAPYGGLVRDAKGNMYGTTNFGGTGTYGCSEFLGGLGTVYRITPDGREKILHSFTGNPDGCYPYAGLIIDAAGNLYGTTGFGGKSNCPPYSCGTVFKLAFDGTETVLHSFALSPDGDEPQAKLTMDSAGNLYGTTAYGGANGYGTVFEVATDGTERVLYAFCSRSNCTDGATPYAGLIMDTSGKLYGTTGYGGNTSCALGEGCGIVFALATDGTESVLHAFSGGSDDWFPVGDLIEDKAGHLYGTAGLGGGPDCLAWDDRCGNVFRLGR